MSSDAPANAPPIARGVIAYNGRSFLREAAHELMELTAPIQVREQITAVARSLTRVVHVEKCWTRKYGLGYVVDLHVVVDGDLRIRDGHRIAHAVKDALRASPLRVRGVLVHVEPDDDGREDSGFPLAGPQSVD